MAVVTTVATIKAFGLKDLLLVLLVLHLILLLPILAAPFRKKQHRLIKNDCTLTLKDTIRTRMIEEVHTQISMTNEHDQEDYYLVQYDHQGAYSHQYQQHRQEGHYSLPQEDSHRTGPPSVLSQTAGPPSAHFERSSSLQQGDTSTNNAVDGTRSLFVSPCPNLGASPILSHAGYIGNLVDAAAHIAALSPQASSESSLPLVAVGYNDTVPLTDDANVDQVEPNQFIKRGTSSGAEVKNEDEENDDGDTKDEE
ncbi:hypothetical protein BGX24_005676 [Mortierella sp. AD032]|nr:hypothetical protein BGX24_005676 [Mortierella sp. AD032]